MRVPVSIHIVRHFQTNRCVHQHGELATVALFRSTIAFGSKCKSLDLLSEHCTVCTCYVRKGSPEMSSWKTAYAESRTTDRRNRITGSRWPSTPVAQSYDLHVCLFGGVPWECLQLWNNMNNCMVSETHGRSRHQLMMKEGMVVQEPAIWMRVAVWLFGHTSRHWSDVCVCYRDGKHSGAARHG